jgi:putative transposase
MVRLAVELGEVAFEVRAYVPHDLFQPLKVLAGEHRVPVFRDENQVRMQHENTVPASAYVAVFSHETNYNSGVQLRYSYRLYPAPAQREALARAFGCARVVFNDALAARKEAHKAGEPYIADKELSVRLTAAKKTPERSWLGEVSSVALQQALADLNAAYRNFLASVAGKRKGPKIAPPRPGITRLSIGPLSPGQGIQLTRRALGLAVGGMLHPVIGQRFPLDRAADAHAAIEARVTIGKTLLIANAEGLR